MYGYVTPDKAKLMNKDFMLYRAFYCGICKAAGKKTGLLSRLLTNYDIAFLSAFLHSYLEEQPQYDYEACILSPFKKKHVVSLSPLMKRIMSLNIIMAYHKLNDDIIDGGGIKKRISARVLKKAYLKSKEALPVADEIMQAKYDELRALEKQNTATIDKVSDVFATALRDCVRLIAEERQNDLADNFFYNLGKYIYLIDALDDIDEDYRRGNYNPFLAAYGNFRSRKQFFTDNATDISFIMNITINQMIESFNQLRLKSGCDLLKNIVYYGFRRKLSMVLASDKKLKPEKI